MEEVYVKVITSQMAREKGFDEKCDYIYKHERKNKNYVLTYSPSIKNSELSRYGKPACAPTQSFLAMWLRKKHHLLITILSKSQKRWDFRITRPNEEFDKAALYKDFPSYEEAMSYALQECLNLI